MLSDMMLGVTNKTIMLNAVMLSVVMPNVIAQYKRFYPNLIL
jgi:hypothetical protein